jgi:hypothetical protein
MLKRKTVFVLGAGASVPFGFPTGAELSREIVERSNTGEYVYNTLKGTGFGDQQIERFRQSFFGSGRNSIDAFLEHRPDHLEIGKAAIAATLIPYERHERVFTFDNGNWLRYLFDQMNTSFDQFGKNELSIVTFNYDRCVEYFLFTALKNSYGKPDAECIEAVNQIPIIHLHGELGPLPWQDQNGREFTPALDNIGTATRNMRIIHEELEEGRYNDFRLAHQMMLDAYRVYFLGFGFNKLNVDRLDIRGLQPEKCHTTAIGLSSHEMKQVSQNCDGRMHFHGQDCITFCRETVEWI